jgi:hypothetical protein
VHFFSPDCYLVVLYCYYTFVGFILTLPSHLPVQGVSPRHEEILYYIFQPFDIMVELLPSVPFYGGIFSVDRPAYGPLAPQAGLAVRRFICIQDALIIIGIFTFTFEQ